MNLLRAGRALLVRDAAMGTHLWFVLTDPDPDRGWVVLVMLVTVKPHTDRTLHLDVGDHPFIRHASAVDFGTATYAPAAKLEAALSSGRTTLHADMSPDLLARVRAGLLTSARTPQRNRGRLPGGVPALNLTRRPPHPPRRPLRPAPARLSSS